MLELHLNAETEQYALVRAAIEEVIPTYWPTVKEYVAMYAQGDISAARTIAQAVLAARCLTSQDVEVTLGWNLLRDGRKESALQLAERLRSCADRVQLS